jgi:hypothetical protein
VGDWHLDERNIVPANHQQVAWCSAGRASPGPRTELPLKPSTESLKSDLLAALRDSDQRAAERGILIALNEAQVEDIEPLLEFAKTLGFYEGRRIRNGIVARWSELDPVAAAQFARMIESRDDRQQALKVVGKEWAKKDAAAAKAWAASLRAGSEQNTAAIGIAATLAKEDPAAALSWVQQFPGTRRSYDACAQVFRIWAERDGAVAAQQALALPPSAARSNAISTTAQTWGEKNPQAAFAWANSVPEADIRSGLVHSIVWEWAAKDPAAAISQVLSLPAGEARNDAIGTAANAIACNDIEAAKRLIEHLPEGTARGNAVISVMGNLLSNTGDPKPVVEYALTMPPGEARNTMLSFILRSGGEMQNPEEALTYLSARLPADRVRREIINHALQDWSARDPQAAIEWALEHARAQSGSQATACYEVTARLL